MTDGLEHIAKDLRPLAVAIEALMEDPENAREHSDAQVEAIAGSLTTFGQRKPIVARGGVVKAGNGTLRAARALGWTHLAVSSADDLTDAGADAFALADNRTTDLSTWNEQRLGAALERARARGIDLTKSLGFSQREVGTILARVKREAQADDPKVAPANVAASTNPGDLYLLDGHRLLCGDSFSAEARGRLMPEPAQRLDMALMDPPFAIYGSSTGIGRDIADDKMVRPFFEGLFRAVSDSVKPFAHVYIHCDWRSWAAILEAARRADLIAKNCLVWDKGHFGTGGMYGNAHEFVGFFAKMPEARTMMSAERKGLRSVVGKANIPRFPRVGGDEREHNAAKPVELLMELIHNSSDEGETVLDLFGGSGSTLMAAERSARRCYMMEVEPKWCDVILARWERLTGKTAELDSPAP